MAKIHLTESQLRGTIREAVSEMVNELTYKRMKQTYDKLRKQKRYKEADDLNNTFQDMYSGYIGDTNDGKPMARITSLSADDDARRFGYPYFKDHIARCDNNNATVRMNGNTVELDGGTYRGNHYKYGHRNENPSHYGDEESFYDDMADKAKEMDQWKKGKVGSNSMRTDIVAESLTREIMQNVMDKLNM